MRRLVLACALSLVGCDEPQARRRIVVDVHEPPAPKPLELPSARHYPHGHEHIDEAVRSKRPSAVAFALAKAFGDHDPDSTGVIDLERGLIDPSNADQTPRSLSPEGALLELIRLLWSPKLNHREALAPRRDDSIEPALDLLETVVALEHPSLAGRERHDDDDPPPCEAERIRVCAHVIDEAAHPFALIPRQVWRGCLVFDVSEHRGLAARPMTEARLHRYLLRRHRDAGAMRPGHVECVVMRWP